MRTKQMTKPAAVTLPLTALKCLYKSARGKKIVCEIDVAALKRVNEPNTLDEMVGRSAARVLRWQNQDIYRYQTTSVLSQ